MTSCMPCSVGLLSYPRSGICAQPSGLRGVTVTDRYVPLVTAAYGTRVARPARTTALPLGGDGSQLGQRARLVLGHHRLVGRARGLAAAGRDANLVYGPAPWLALVPSSRERLGKGQGLHTCNDRCQVRQSPRSWCISSSHCKGGVP